MRLDQEVVSRGLTTSRSQAESYIRLGYVTVNGSVQKKPGYVVHDNDRLIVAVAEQYVSRAALKLASITAQFKLDFRGKTVLDVGSSTGGFTDFALRRGAQKVVAVEVGTNQLHLSLRGDSRIELHEQTDIREFTTDQPIDIVVADVSFISLRKILPHIVTLCSHQTQIIVMLKPQFEATESAVKHKGVIKNDRMRRDILKDFEVWANKHFIIKEKADSAVAGEKGNLERFYWLQTLNTK